MRLRSLLLVCTALALLGPARAAAEPAAVEDQRFTLDLGGRSYQIPYRADIDLHGPPSDLRRAVVVIHGTRRNAGEYYDYVRDAAVGADAAATTLLLAPQFLTVEEIEAAQLGSSMLYWSEGGWKRGDLSEDTATHPRPDRVSSFGVLEEFLRAVVAVAPDLETVVLAGHSAGGQFVQRFAAGNGVDGTLGAVQLRYVVANPGTYLYLSGERWVPGTADEFAVPSGTDCPTWYDDYKYGLLDLNEYMDAVGASAIRDRYVDRQVTYLLGEDDDDPADPYLDRSCAAVLQGPHRLARGVIFRRSLDHVFGSAATGSHNGALVPGVGHSGRRMFGSDCGQGWLFGRVDLLVNCERIDDALPPATTTAPARRLGFDGASPNPFNPRTRLAFRGVPGEAIEVTVHDAAGRTVRRFGTVVPEQGRVSFTWDGTDHRGAAVGSGVYRVLARQAGRTASGSIALIR